MKLLFDYNLSYKLVTRLADFFPDQSMSEAPICTKQTIGRYGNTRGPMALSLSRKTRIFIS